MIQVAGRLAKKPYYIKEINMQVNSLEEINYFVYNHMNLVYRDFFCEELFDYIEKDLGRKAMASQLRVMDKAGSDLKAFISCLLKESYYYDAAELSEISGFVTNINNISEPERMKIEGDSLFRQRKYAAAKSVYLKILNDPEAAQGKQFLADCAFRAGLCFANMFLCRSACAYFNMAYDIFPEADYAKACVYISVVLEDEEELLRSIIRYKVTDEALEKIKANAAVLRKKILNSESFSEFSRNIEDREKALGIAKAFKDEYYRMTE